jgi:hypothetical protein
VGGASVSIGVVGGTLEDSPGVGVLGEAVGNHEEAYAVKGDALGNPLSWAGLFNGDVYITGQIYIASAASQIDHPLDPEHKVLTHAAVESPEMKTIYDGLVTTNAEGYAEVALPDYFEVLNRDVRYQLTVVGDFAQAIVARKVEGNRFTIRTSQPGVEVSWLVSGIRADAWAAQHPTIVERDKAPSDIGHYLHPQAFGKSRDEGMRSSRPSIATDKIITPRLITPTLSRARHVEPLLSKTRAVAPADDSDLE